MPIWQPRFYDFNVWTEAQASGEAALHASQSSEAGIGARARAVAMEQLSLLQVWRSGIGPAE